ncbi:MAG: adenylate/guanylate cyclase domain-containing protein [Actinomycetota bacterium]
MYSANELAALADTTVDRVRWMTDLKILDPGPDGYRPSDIQLVRVADAMDRSGIALEDMGRLIADGVYSMGWGDLLYPDPVATSDATLRQVCEELDLPLGFARRFFLVALHLPAPEPDQRLRDDDVELLRIMGTVFNLAGRDEDVGIASARYFGENLRRLAESQVQFFREHFEEPMFAMGMSQREAIDLLVQVAAPLMPMGHRVVDLLYRRHLEHYSMEDVVANMEMTMRRAGIVQRSSEHPPAIAFCDLTGSTQLTERLGDEGAARMAERLAEVLRETTARHDGRVVKLLGDGAMLYFHGPAGAARAGLELVREAASVELPPLRMGVHVGQAVFRDGDYYGRTVIVAARVTDMIDPEDVVLTADAVAEISSDDLTFEDLGPVELKGVSDPVSLYRTRVE